MGKTTSVLAMFIASGAIDGTGITVGTKVYRLACKKGSTVPGVCKLVPKLPSSSGPYVVQPTRPVTSAKKTV